MTPTRIFLSAVALIGLSACDAARPTLGGLGEPEVTRLNQIAPPGAEPGSCWGKHVTPAIIETVTHQVIVQPTQVLVDGTHQVIVQPTQVLVDGTHQVIVQPTQVLVDGTVTQPAIYKTETLQQIVRERREIWFQTPCADIMTPEFIASVQRALAARELYRGKISGEMDASTRAAVRRYQKPLGLDSGILSLTAARKMGLVAVVIDATG